MATLEQLYMIGAPTDEEKARMLADQLRGKRQAASAFALSTVPEIAQSAQASQQNVLQAAQRGGALREATLRRQQQQRQHEDRMQSQAQGRALTRSLAQIKASGQPTGSSSFDKMPVSVQKEYIAARNTAEIVPDVIQAVKDNEDAFGAYAVKSAHMPEWTPNFLMEPLKSWEQGTFSETGRQARYDVYSRAYKIIHELAGAQVSAHEKARIEGFLPAPNDKPDVVVSKLQSALDTARDIQATQEKLYGDVESYNDEFDELSEDQIREIYQREVGGLP